jgi:glycosyltransferase involved in cell wall biosynthesis
MAGDSKVSGSVLSVDPPIVYTPIGSPHPMRWIDAYEPRLRNAPAALLVYMAGLFEGGLVGKTAVTWLRHYRRIHPQHEVHLLCNAPYEVEVFARFGESALLLNHNLTVSETIFRPLRETETVFDAIYNARLSKQKRIELAAAIESVAYITYLQGEPTEETRQLLAHMRGLGPAHKILNRFENGVPVKLKAPEVNVAYNRVAVGLCLSAVEGAMVSSMEYLLAGLPIVTTPSRGGRELFFDSEYCLTVAPDPRAIREAVETLRKRHIPREYIRQRTLARIEPQRRAFLALLDGILERNAYAPRFGGPWPWPDRRSLCRSKSIAEHFDQAALLKEGRRPASRTEARHGG